MREVQRVVIDFLLGIEYARRSFFHGGKRRQAFTKDGIDVHVLDNAVGILFMDVHGRVERRYFVYFSDPDLFAKLEELIN